MNGNSELLNYIYQNSQMGVITINELLKMIEDNNFKLHLEKQLEGYTTYHKKAKEMLNQNGYDEKSISLFDKIKTYTMLNLQTLTNKTTSHIAEMMVIGSNMGVIDAIKNLKKYKDAEPNIVQLQQELLTFEENNMVELKKFL